MDDLAVIFFIFVTVPDKERDRGTVSLRVQEGKLRPSKKSRHYTQVTSTCKQELDGAQGLLLVVNPTSEPPPTSYVATLAPSVAVFEDEASREIIKVE